MTIKYKMNLVKSIRIAERRQMKHGVNMAFMLIVCFGILALSGFYAYTKLGKMQVEIAKEKAAIRKITAEYREYQEMQTSIDKADVELLNRLLTNRVYWTKVLDGMASHLPAEQPTSYWITKFGYRGQAFAVHGFGYITEQQEQLLALDEYLNRLRADPNYTEFFNRTNLKSAVRSDESGQGSRVNERVSFEYASTRKGGR